MIGAVTDVEQVVDPRAEAQARIGDGFDPRVLEPAPTGYGAPPWFADDPVLDGDGSGRPVAAPVPRWDWQTWDELTRARPDLASWCADRWLGAWRALVVPSDVDALGATRHTWHTLAEHVLAPARHRSNGKIGLRFTRGGFGTPFFGAAEQVRVAVDGLLVIRDGVLVTHPVTTVAAAAAAVAIVPGAPVDVYTPTTRLEPVAPLHVDDASARFLGDWFGFGASVLEELRVKAPVAETPARVQLWPEHFDLSFDFGDEAAGTRATYGASPGDAAHELPYVYVSPWSPQDGPFWNEGSYASLSLDAFVDADAAGQRSRALEFFAQCRAELGGR
jgi:hypothetical protein